MLLTLLGYKVSSVNFYCLQSSFSFVLVQGINTLNIDSRLRISYFTCPWPKIPTKTDPVIRLYLKGKIFDYLDHFYMQEAAIEDYFKPIDKEAETLMKMQLEGEEKTMRDMVKAMQQQALFENTESNKTAEVHDTGTNQNQDPASSNAPHQAQAR